MSPLAHARRAQCGAWVSLCRESARGASVLCLDDCACTRGPAHTMSPLTILSRHAPPAASSGDELATWRRPGDNADADADKSRSGCARRSRDPNVIYYPHVKRTCWESDLLQHLVIDSPCPRKSKVYYVPAHGYLLSKMRLNSGDVFRPVFMAVDHSHPPASVNEFLAQDASKLTLMFSFHSAYRILSFRAALRVSFTETIS